MSTASTSIKTAPTKIKFDYIKGNFFRTARADGALAGTNGFSDVILSFYSERTPIPKQVVHLLTPEHALGDEIVEERVSRDAVVREVEVCLSMSLSVAKAVQALLAKQIDAIESAQTELPNNSK
ncbi:MAG TPA: hypothetical protein VHZ07_14320 [Bryobacteraceae bacterium]|jgi:hypothetical protein|nr:hypothetical protein [Bryobacteraceae bacterium]